MGSQPQKKSTKEFHFCSSSSFEEDVKDVVSGIVNETKKDEDLSDSDDSVKKLLENLEVSLGDQLDYSFKEENLSRNSSLERKIILEKVKDDFENFTNLKINYN